MMSRVLVACVAACLLQGAAAEDERTDLMSITVTGAEGEVTPLGIGGTTTLSLSYMYDGLPAWGDLPGSMLVDPVPSIVGVPTGVPQTLVPGGSVITFHCPPAAAGLGQDHCDAWVWVYSCPWSCPTPTDAILPPMLLGNGWEHTMCAPRFTNGVSAYRHRMVGFRFQVANGASEAFTTGGEVANVALGIDLGVDCTALADETACLAPLPANGRCEWTGSSCVRTMCKRPGQGPPPPCTECSLDGVAGAPL